MKEGVIYESGHRLLTVVGPNDPISVRRVGGTTEGRRVRDFL